MIKNSPGSTFKHQNHLVLFWCSKSNLFWKKKVTSPRGGQTHQLQIKLSSHLELFGSFFEATRHPKGYNLGEVQKLSKIDGLVPFPLGFVEKRNTNYLQKMVDFPTGYLCRKVNLQDSWSFLKFGYWRPTPTMLFLPSWESCIFGRRAFLYAHVGPFKTLSPAERSKPTQHLGLKA